MTKGVQNLTVYLTPRQRLQVEGKVTPVESREAAIARENANPKLRAVRWDKTVDGPSRNRAGVRFAYGVIEVEFFRKLFDGKGVA